MGACASMKSAVIVPVADECFICCQKYTTSIPLTCGHRFHTECVMNWWRQTARGNVLTCPMCRQSTHSCFMGISDKDIVAYFRQDGHDTPKIVFADEEEPKRIIHLPEIEARDMALSVLMVKRISNIMIRDMKTLSVMLDDHCAREATEGAFHNLIDKSVRMSQSCFAKLPFLGSAPEFYTNLFQKWHTCDLQLVKNDLRVRLDAVVKEYQGSMPNQ